MSKTLNISLVGIGGQGTLLVSEILCRVALLGGKDVKKSEVHGMAQRGGSVVSQVRIGDQVRSPLIAVGETDILVGFEKLESLRYAHLLSPEGVALVNEQEIRPVTVSSGQAEWSENLNKKLQEVFPKLEPIPALDIAKSGGSARVINLVMIGAMSNYLDTEESVWKQAITPLVKPQYLQFNLKAFDAGREACCSVYPG